MEMSEITDNWRVIMAISQIFYGQYNIWDIYVLGLKTKNTKFFVGKTTKSNFPWTMDSQCQKSADSYAENTPNAPKFISQVCLPKHKSLRYVSGFIGRL